MVACSFYMGYKIILVASYSQSELSRLSGVNIRNIQLYEQGVQDINWASAATLVALARPHARLEKE